MLLRCVVAMATLVGVLYAPAEIAPGLWSLRKIELEHGVVELGMNHAEVTAVLGKGWKYKQTPRPYTAAKLYREARRVRSLVMPAFSGLLALSEDVAQRCGQRCWIEILSQKIGKKLELRIQLLGESKDAMRVQWIFLDYDRMAIRSWRQQWLRDQREAAIYVETPNGVYRVSFDEHVARIEVVKVP